MYKILKHAYNDRHKLFFSSDWHIFHDPSWEVPIWKQRGYNSVGEANQGTLNKINEKVPENATIYYLGDGFLNTTDDKVLEWLSQIKCKDIRYIWGNHCSNMYRLYKQEVLRQYNLTDVEVYPLKMGNITFLGNHLEIQVGKKVIVMNHFPLKIWHRNNRGSWNLSAHSHNSDIERLPSHPIGKGLDVGIDCGHVWGWDELEDVMSTKTIFISDHHDANL